MRSISARRHTQTWAGYTVPISAKGITNYTLHKTYQKSADVSKKKKTGLPLLNGLQEAMEDMTNATKGFKSDRNVFADKYSTRGVVNLRKLAYMCFKILDDARRSIRDHCNKSTVSRSRFERMKSSWDVVNSALDHQDFKKYSGPELADWMLKQLQAKSSNALSKDLEKSISVHSRQPTGFPKVGPFKPQKVHPLSQYRPWGK
ncbi:hypothetical protein BDR26DRAFT_892767 [Obelidium mucronatum]|nr:hypothetical protein BDR26DRAFT_892767 [Obelidium mucronatum]